LCAVSRLAYLGTPQMAVAPLRALVEAGHDVVLCVTRPDRRRGRGGATTPSPVKAAAIELGVAVSHELPDVASAGVELAVVVAYGRIIPSTLLAEIPMLNVHFSLLPRWRGAAPVERAILAGDAETGVCLMKIEEGLDTGPVYARRAVPIREDETLEQLRSELVEQACSLLVEVLAGGVSDLPDPEPQQGHATVASKITPEDLHLDWHNTAEQLGRVVRLGRAWTTFRGRRLSVLEATVDNDGTTVAEVAPGTLVGTAVATTDGALVLRRVQPESRSPMPADDWIRGSHPLSGERLGSD
jgi:methionyl-tRNA formyltransferase